MNDSSNKVAEGQDPVSTDSTETTADMAIEPTSIMEVSDDVSATIPVEAKNPKVSKWVYAYFLLMLSLIALAITSNGLIHALVITLIGLSMMAHIVVQVKRGGESRLSANAISRGFVLSMMLVLAAVFVCAAAVGLIGADMSSLMRLVGTVGIGISLVLRLFTNTMRSALKVQAIGSAVTVAVVTLLAVL